MHARFFSLLLLSPSSLSSHFPRPNPDLPPPTTNKTAKLQNKTPESRTSPQSLSSPLSRAWRLLSRLLDYASDAVSDAAPASVSRATVDAGVRLAAVLVAVSVARSLLGLLFTVGSVGLALLVASKVMAEEEGGSGRRRGGRGGRGRGGKGRSVFEIFSSLSPGLFFSPSLSFSFFSPCCCEVFELTAIRNSRYEKTKRIPQPRWW